MFCGRCDKLIRPGEQYTEHSNPGASGAGGTVYRHVELCKRVPIQTAPAPLRH